MTWIILSILDRWTEFVLYCGFLHVNIDAINVSSMKRYWMSFDTDYLAYIWKAIYYAIGASVAFSYECAGYGPTHVKYINTIHSFMREILIIFIISLWYGKNNVHAVIFFFTLSKLMLITIKKRKSVIKSHQRRASCIHLH